MGNMEKLAVHLSLHGVQVNLSLLNERNFINSIDHVILVIENNSFIIINLIQLLIKREDEGKRQPSHLPCGGK